MATDSDRDADEAVGETYVAALQHDLVDVDDETRLVGVVRRPTGWFRSAVDENRPALGPPEGLLDEVKARQESLKVDGLCDEEAHNAAWAECDFRERYEAYLNDATDARSALGELEARARDGERVVLVCFEGEDKRCHRHALVERLEARLGE